MSRWRPHRCFIDPFFVKSRSTGMSTLLHPKQLSNKFTMETTWIVVYDFSMCFLIVLRMSLALLLLHCPVQPNLTVTRQYRTSSSSLLGSSKKTCIAVVKTPRGHPNLPSKFGMTTLPRIRFSFISCVFHSHHFCKCRASLFNYPLFERLHAAFDISTHCWDEVLLAVQLQQHREHHFQVRQTIQSKRIATKSSKFMK